MTGRTYGQHCGIARALELVGERWALLVVRELLVGPKRYTDLRRRLPRIPTNILSARLKELEQAGIVRRRVLPRPAAAVVYELTAYGQELDEVVLALGRWGARSLGEPRPGEIRTEASMVMALRSTFQPEAAGDLVATYELRVGPIVVHARVADGTLDAGPGPLPGADLVIEAGSGIRPLLTGEVAPAEAVANGSIRLGGPADLLTRFVDLFRILPRPPESPA